MIIYKSVVICMLNLHENMRFDLRGECCAKLCWALNSWMIINMLVGIDMNDSDNWFDIGMWCYVQIVMLVIDLNGEHV